MSVLLDPPASVLVTGPETPLSAARGERVLDGTATSLRTETDPSAVTEAAAESDVGCAVVAGDPSEPAATNACEAVRAGDEDLPVVFLAADADGPLASLLTSTRAASIVPRSAPPDSLREAVDDALETYREQRVRAEESDMLRAMLEQLGKSIYFKDEGGRIIHHADVGGGPDPEAARGKTDLEIYDQDALAEAHERELRVVEEESKLVDFEERVPEDDLWMRTTKVPWRDDGDVRGLIGLSTDVTEYKRSERELEELRHRFSSFVRQLRHDLKTQLQIAIGNLEPWPGDEERLDTVQRSLREIDRVVEDYGRLAKRSIEVDGDASPADLRETVEAAWASVEVDDAALTVDVEPETYVNAPESMVLVVLENLLWEAATAAGDELTVRVGNTEEGFYVEHSGARLSADKRALLEQPGYATTQDGSGHELRVVKDEIDRHLWTLTVSEGRAGGARFEVGNCLVDAVGTPAEDGPTVHLTEERAVGDLEVGGEATYDRGTNRWFVRADGDDVFRQDNDFYYVYAPVTGDACVSAKVPRIDPVTDVSKGGVMIRSSLSGAASYGYVGKTPGRGTEVLWRSTDGADGRSRQLEERAVPFDWYRLDRRGDEMTMSVSLDGERWQTVDVRRVETDDTVYAGLVVCSALQGKQCEAVFEDAVVCDER